MNLTAADPPLEAFLGRVVLFGHLSEEQGIVYQILIRQVPARFHPYYVFQCDPVEGLVERFSVPIETARKIESYCAERIGGLALPRFVMDLPHAKRKLPI